MFVFSVIYQSWNSLEVQFLNFPINVIVFFTVDASHVPVLSEASNYVSFYGDLVVANAVYSNTYEQHSNNISIHVRTLQWSFRNTLSLMERNPLDDRIR